MRLSRLMPSQRGRTIGAFTTLSLALATLAILHDGTEVADLDLNDGGVWVTNLNLASGVQVAAHFNYQSREIDAHTQTIPGADFDLTQEANSIVLHGQKNQLRSVNTASWAADPSPTQGAVPTNPLIHGSSGR